jgi:hypothetical protein
VPWRRIGEWRYSSTHCLTSALDGGEWSVSRTGRFTSSERAPGTVWIGGWVGPRAEPNLYLLLLYPTYEMIYYDLIDEFIYISWYSTYSYYLYLLLKQILLAYRIISAYLYTPAYKQVNAWNLKRFRFVSAKIWLLNARSEWFSGRISSLIWHVSILLLG